IPAVIAYNKLQAEATKAQNRLEGFADEFSAILSRQVDEARERMPHDRAAA
ncbi:MAG: protein TolQ, partial [Beijerinckiaceae bacterium]